MADEVVTEEIKPKQADSKQYRSIADLMAMDKAEVQSLWEMIPPERQKFYEGAYTAALSSLGYADITDDQALGVIEQILTHYESGQVPIITGNRWVQVPSWVREIAEKGESARQPKPIGTPDRKPATTGKRTIDPKIMVAAVGFLILFLCIGFQLFNRLSRNSSNEISEKDMTSTADAFVIVPTASPTPLGITNADRIISDGGDFANYYPVLLELDSAAEGTSRIFVVQQQPIEITDWEFDARNEDIASWISGLLVRPVIGLSYSDSNAQYLQSMKPDDTILLHMSTGTILHFDVEAAERVPQQYKDIFSQDAPGIAVVLLGEATAADRLVITGHYPPEQELLRDGKGLNIGNAPEVKNIGEATAITGTDGTMSVDAAYTTTTPEGVTLPPELAYLFVDVTVTAGQQGIDTNQLIFNLIDNNAVRYSPVVFGSTTANFAPLLGQQIQAGTTSTGTVGFYVPRDISSQATLTVRSSTGPAIGTYLLSYAPPQLLEPAEVALLTVATKRPEEGIAEVVVSVSIFNPNKEPMSVSTSDLYFIFSHIEPVSGQIPTGPQTLPTTVNGSAPAQFVIPGGQEVQLELRTAWDGSPYLGIVVLEYKYAAKLTETE